MTVSYFENASGTPVEVPVSDNKPLPVEGTLAIDPPLPATYTDGSGTITSGGSSQQVFAANASRRYLFVLNISDTDAWINFGTAAVADQPSIKIPANGGYYEPLVPSGATVNIIGATTGKKFVAKQG